MRSAPAPTAPRPLQEVIRPMPIAALASAPSRAASRAPARAPSRAAALLAALTMLSGCGTVGDWFGENTPDVEFGVLEPSSQAPSQRDLPKVEVKERRPVERVVSLEIGRIYEGVMLTAYGVAPRSDWFSPQLVPRRGGRPGPDGFIEYDFVAAPPALNGFPETAKTPPGSAGQRRIRADVPVPSAALLGASGLRVHAARNAQGIKVNPGQ